MGRLARFPKRVLEPIEVAYTDEERAIHAALRQYAELRQASGRGQRREVRHRVRAEDAQEAALLQPRRLPHHAGAAREIAAHGQASARRVRKPSLGILQRELDRVDEDYADDDEYDEATTDAVDAASLLFSEPSAEELALLKQMKDVGGTGVGAARLEGEGADPLAQRRTSGPARNGATSGSSSSPSTGPRRTGCKTSWPTEGFTGGDRLLTMYGGMDSKDREESKPPSRPSPEAARCASCWPPTPPPKASTSRTTAPG